MSISMKKILMGGIIGGVIIFLFSHLFWKNVVMPQNRAKNYFTNEGEVMDAVTRNAPFSGIYVMPNMHHVKDKPAELEKQVMERVTGTNMVAVVTLGGIKGTKVQRGIVNLLVQITLASIVTWFLGFAKLDYKKSIKFVTIAGVLVALAKVAPLAIYLNYPFIDWSLLFLTTVLSWFFAGLGIAKVAK